MIVNIAYNTTEPNIGLKLNRESSALKCYMGDTGLLISLAFDEIWHAYYSYMICNSKKHKKV